MQQTKWYEHLKNHCLSWALEFVTTSTGSDQSMPRTQVFHDQAIEKAQQAAWSLLWEAARDGDMDKVRALVDPQPVTYPDRNNKTRDRPISVDMKHVDWVRQPDLPDHRPLAY